MNGSKSPGPNTRSGDARDNTEDALSATNGHDSPSQQLEAESRASQLPTAKADDDNTAGAHATTDTNGEVAGDRPDEDAASEAETLIDSPVKKKEAEKKKQNALAAANVKSEKPQRTRIGSLPVPQDDDDDEMDSTASPMQSTEVSAAGKATSNGDPKEEEDVDMANEDEDAEGSDEDDDLSSAQSSPEASRESSRSRAVSEGRKASRARKDGSPPNPRKRKHRASSVDDIPSNKRRSMDPPARRRLRGMHSEDNAGKTERSPSPPSRGHRRAISTQSALEGAADGVSRQRRGSQFPVREPRSARGWEESDASSETTTRGQDEFKHPQRGLGRSTSTPGGRLAGREAKRHVNKYGFTKLAEACEVGDLDLVKDLRDKDPESLELAEYAGNKPLQIAALNGNAEVVAYLIKEGAQIDCANVDKDTPLIDAAENGHLDVVKLLLDAGVDPLRQNMKGQQALDVIKDETEDAASIRAALHAAIEEWNSNSAKQRRQEEEESRHSRMTSKELHFMARTYQNMLRLVQNNDRTGVQEFLAARVPVDNHIIAAAAKTGDVYLVNMLLAEMAEKKLRQKPEEPMLAVLGSSHFEMVKVLTELEWFDPLWTDSENKGWVELAEEKQGPMWKQESQLMKSLKEKVHGSNERRSSSPVTKRESGARRRLTQKRTLQDDSEDDAGHHGASSVKTNNKKRLLNRRDLKSSKTGAGVSDDEDEGRRSSEEDAPGELECGEREETETKPPDTPSTGTRRRLRSKSQSGSPEVPPKSLRKKRSMSFRNGVTGAGSAMPTVNEEDTSNTGSSNIDVTSSTTATDKARKDREEEAKVALDLAKKAEEKRQEEEAAEAEAKRAQAEADRKAEEERKAAEARRAEEARKEEEQRAEKARKEAEEHAERERERQRQRAEQKQTYRNGVLEALPKAIGRLLERDAADTDVEGEAKKKSWLVQHFTPLRIFTSDEGGRRQRWVLNLQAAPLIAENAVELFIAADSIDYEDSLAAKWTTSDLKPDHWIELDRQLSQMPLHEEDNPQDEEGLTFDEELQRTAERYNAFVDAKRGLAAPDSKAVLRRIRLEDVLNNLRPSLKGTPLEMEFVDPSSEKQREVVLKQFEIQEKRDFVGRMREFWDGCQTPRAVGSVGEIAAGAGREWAGVTNTDVVVVHEK